MSDNDTKIRMMDLIDVLRQSEGASIEIPCPNPDFDGPAQLVRITSESTNWQPRTFYGNCLLECLEAAFAEQEARDE